VSCNSPRSAIGGWIAFARCRLGEIARTCARLRPNLAARLEGVGAAHAVVVAEGTQRLRGDRFGPPDLGPGDLKQRMDNRSASREGRRGIDATLLHPACLESAPCRA